MADHLLLWMGTPTYLVRYRPGPLATKIVQVDPAPTGAGADLTGWLATSVRPGTEVHVVYQHHLLQAEVFPQLGPEDVTGPMRLRTANSLLLPERDLTGLTVRLDLSTATQAAYAAVPAAHHQATVRLLESAKVVMGRVGFAGQLALGALAKAAPRGGWSVLAGVAGAPQLLVGVGSRGEIVAAAMPESTTPAGALELAKLYMPRSELASTPLDLAAARPAGAALPTTLAAALPLFFADARWRIASRRDIDYPYYFSAPTWAGALTALVLAGFTGWLQWQSWQIQKVAGQVASLKRSTAAVQAEIKADQSRLADLRGLSKNLQIISGESFDNAAWMAWLAAVRDAHAPRLLFRSITVDGSALTLDGLAQEPEVVIGFFKELTTKLGESAATMPNLSADGDRRRFEIRIERGSGMPPAGA